MAFCKVVKRGCEIQVKKKKNGFFIFQNLHLSPRPSPMSIRQYTHMKEMGPSEKNALGNNLASDLDCPLQKEAYQEPHKKGVTDLSKNII